ncbi:MAG: caspase family protein [Rhodocyclaceae bacterium]|nr:caspase family protein [Rhodocyclaceae bacterium]
MQSNRPWFAAALCIGIVTLAFASALPAWGQNAAGGTGEMGVVRWPGGDLYAEANASSEKIASVPRGDSIEFIRRDGLWSMVRWRDKDDVKEGWMSRIFIDWRPAAPSAAPVSSPMVAPAAAAVSVAAVPARSRGRAVIFGISNYQADQHIPTLTGVPLDMPSAAVMAQLMGISADRVTIYRDAEASKAGIVAVLSQLAKEVAPDEPVLVYYSGHGGRIADPDNPARCIEGLIAYDAQFLTAAEMAELLHPLAKITDKLFVFFDSCHSGGLSATRAVGDQRLKPKFVARGDLSNCSEIVNVLRTPEQGTRAAGRPYVYAAAARADEVSLDDPEKGGLATSNFVRCMVEGNNPQTVDAIRACAQKGIDLALADSSSFKPPHLAITGDLNAMPEQTELSKAQREKLLASATQPSRGAQPAASKAAQVSIQLGSRGWPQVANPRQAFAAIAARADASPLRVKAPDAMKIDIDSLRLEVQAPAEGYLYLFEATADGKSAVLLFPNLVDRDHRVTAGEVLHLPRSSWPLVSGGPEGETQLLVVFARAERDIAQLVGEEAGPFLDLAVSPAGMQALALAISRSAYADEANCLGRAKPAVQCDARYSATLKVIKETADR